MMQSSVKTLVIRAFILAASILLNLAPAAGTGVNWHDPVVQLRLGDCDLPAPGNFHVTDIGTNYITTTWNWVPGADGYVLEAYIANTTTLVDSEVLPASASSGTVQVPAGGSYDLKIAAFKNGCPPSANASFIFGVDVLVIDLIVSGRAVPNCIETLPAPNGCYTWPSNQGLVSVWFQVEQNGNPIAAYEVNPNLGPVQGANCTYNEGHFTIGESGNVGPYTDAYMNTTPPCITTPQTPNTSQFPVINIKTTAPNLESSVLLFALHLDNLNSNGGSICVEEIAGEPYTYTFIKGRTCNRESAPEVSSMSYVQSLFTESLLVATPGRASGPVTFRLFNLNGQPVFERQYEPSQEYNLPTASLRPGFYLLRMETNGQSQTYKVVKAR